MREKCFFLQNILCQIIDLLEHRLTNHGVYLVDLSGYLQPLLIQLRHNGLGRIGQFLLAFPSRIRFIWLIHSCLVTLSQS